jgi:phage baseplate assembly protein W
MRSIKFPNMFRSNSTEVWKSSEYLDATKQNTYLILRTERGELECDPYFGLMLKHYLFSQNNYILRDMLIDTIYTQLALFLPQLKILRESIEIIQDRERGKVTCRFSGINQIDYTHNTFNLLLFEDSDF